MKVGMCQLLDLLTRRTDSAGVAIVAVGAVEILRIGYRQGERSRACCTRKELCVAYAPIINAFCKSLFQRFVTYDIAKSHRLPLLKIWLNIALKSIFSRHTA